MTSPPTASSLRAGWRPLSALGWLAALLSLGHGRPLAGQQTTVSPHGPLKTECRDCHGSEGWTPVRISRRFNHATFNFPLRGAHQAAACMSCHQELTFASTPSGCGDCHQDVHRGEFGPTCERCHSMRGFNDRSVLMRLHETTRFPLQGAHLAVDCESCHAPAAQGGLQFVALSARCVSCHEREFVAARTPDHVAGGFDRTCELCHDARNWTRAHFLHRVALTGAHRALTCDQCHAGHRYQGTPAECVGCHRQNYDGTAQPNHLQVGFSTQCANCHATSSWTAPYDHSRSRFPLTGAHRSVDCAQCHGDGVYAGKPTTCISCHQGDYDGTSNPSHPALQFSTTCGDCHTTTTWQGARFDHDGRFFPIYSGKHRGAWSACADCHNNASNYAVFTCLSCHEHSQGRMDDKHRGRNGYSYDSAACLRCHPTGRSGD